MILNSGGKQMKKMILGLFITIIIILITYINIYKEQVGTNQVSIDNGDYKIYTSIYPIYETAKKIAGNKIDVGLVVPNGTEAHSYEPSPRKIAELVSADLFFYIGIGMEPWIDKAQSILGESSVKTIEISRYLDLIRYEDQELHKRDDHEVYDEHYDDHDEHNEYDDNYDDYHDDYNEYVGENDEHEHEHGQYDPHVWLDPANMRKIAEIIKEELIALDSANVEIYQSNYNKYSKEIELLEEKYQKILLKKSKNEIIVSHAAFGYLAKKYNFEQLAITGITPHGELTPGNIAELINFARENKLEYVFMETLTSNRVVQVLAQEADLEILTLNPFSGLTEMEVENGEDYFTIMEQNLSNLKKALVN